MTAASAGRSIRAVLFDYGDTLITVRRPDQAIDAAYQGIAVYLAETLGRPVPAPGELRSAIHDRLEAAVVAHARSGSLREIDLRGEAANAFAQIGLRVAPPVLDEVARREQEAWWSGIEVTPEAPGVLRAVRALGLRIGVCSNAPYDAAGLRSQLDVVGLGNLIDSTTFSGEVGWRKPSSQIFETALARLGSTAGTTVMVGDSAIADVVGAGALGMRTVRLREHRDDARPDREADEVLDRLEDLPALLERWGAGAPG